MAAEDAVWVGYNNRLRTGIAWYGERQPTQADPSYPVTIEMWAQTNYSSYGYAISGSWNGSWGAGSNSAVPSSGSAPVLLGGPGRLVFTASYDGVQQFSQDFTASGPSAGPSSITRVGEIPRRPTANPTACGKPTFSSVGTNSFKVSFTGPGDWRGPSSGRRYRMQVSTSSSFSSTVWDQYVSSGVTVSGLSSGTTYYVRVRGEGVWWDATRGGAWSSTGTQATIAGVPSAITGRSITAITSSGFTANWAMPNGNGAAIQSIAYEVRDSSDKTARVGTVVKSGSLLDTSVTITGLQNAHNYTFHSRAWNGVAWGPWQVDVDGLDGQLITTLAIAPTLASTPNPSSVARTSFVVPTAAITDNGGMAPTKYRVAYSLPGGTATVKEQSTWAAITVSGLSPLTTYHYSVSAYNSGGWGPYTAYKSVTTLDAAPDDPAEPTVSLITETTARVSWTAPALNSSTLTSYQLVLSTTGSPDAPVKTYTILPGTTQQDVTGLVLGTNYQAFVRAVATPSSSGWSPAAEFRTLGDRSTLHPYHRSSGSWKRFQLYRNTGGTWRRVLLGRRSATTWKREEA